MRVPLLRPSAPQLSQALTELRLLEQSGVLSNFGPINTRFEQEALARFFANKGACMTVCNATIGLMLAIKEAVGESARGKFALMPSFTFPAAAHAAIWCGLTPLLCDIHPRDWAADGEDEFRLLKQYSGRIAVVIPYATFGYPIDLDRYQKIATKFNVPVVVDAAASLGTSDLNGVGFGTGFAGSVVFSMHATKPFGLGEGGLIYSANPDRIARLRAMSNFGFDESHVTSMPGLNGKMSEVGALQGRLRLATFNRVMERRTELFNRYRDSLHEVEFQRRSPGTQAYQFVPALLPAQLSGSRAAIRSDLADRGIITGAYFSPHLLEQPYFRNLCVADPLPVCDDIAARSISLPLFDSMTLREVDFVAECLHDAIDRAERRITKRAINVDQRSHIVH